MRVHYLFCHYIWKCWHENKCWLLKYKGCAIIGFTISFSCRLTMRDQVLYLTYQSYTGAIDPRQSRYSSAIIRGVASCISNHMLFYSLSALFPPPPSLAWFWSFNIKICSSSRRRFWKRTIHSKVRDFIGILECIFKVLMWSFMQGQSLRLISLPF